MATPMTTLVGINWNPRPAWIGITGRLHPESPSAILGIRNAAAGSVVSAAWTVSPSASHPLHRLRWRTGRQVTLTREAISLPVALFSGRPLLRGWPGSSWNGGRDQIGMVAAIRSERWPRPNRGRWPARIGTRTYVAPATSHSFACRGSPFIILAVGVCGGERRWPRRMSSLRCATSCGFRRSRPGIPSVIRAPFQTDAAHQTDLMAPRVGSSRRSSLVMSWRCCRGQAAARGLRRLSPLSSTRCALWMIRSRMASASVGLPTISYQWSIGTWLVMISEPAL